nr:response regulator [Clostridium chromiireducens]
MNKLKIMVVDDSLIMISNLTHTLTEMGHEVVGTARSGSEAVSKSKKLNPDIITMDITMGDINGIEAVEKIMKTDPDKIIIMITSHGQEKMVIDAVSVGAKGYLLKPIKYDNLNKVITDVYKKYGKTQEEKIQEEKIQDIEIQSRNPDLDLRLD